MNSEDSKKLIVGTKVRIIKQSFKSENDQSHIKWFKSHGLWDQKEIIGVITCKGYNSFAVKFSNDRERLFLPKRFELIENVRRGHPLTKIFA